MAMTGMWDPFKLQESLAPTQAAIRRINKELEEYTKDPAEGIYLAQDDSNVTVFHALIVGPKDTPYENGFFYFYVRIPFDYPFKPPLAKLMTTGGGKVRFNPNLYECGKVCLSILGTWPGPCWTPGYRMKGVLVSIQSLMGSEPYYNEPGFSKSNSTKDVSDKYSANIEFETLRVAVLDMVEDKNADARHMPRVLKDKVQELFRQNLDYYKAKLIQKEESGSKFGYKLLNQRLDKLIEKVGVNNNTAQPKVGLNNNTTQPKAGFSGIFNGIVSTLTSSSSKSVPNANNTGANKINSSASKKSAEVVDVKDTPARKKAKHVCPLCAQEFATVDEVTTHAANCQLPD